MVAAREGHSKRGGLSFSAADATSAVHKGLVVNTSCTRYADVNLHYHHWPCDCASLQTIRLASGL